jgi:hypothetical protein
MAARAGSVPVMSDASLSPAQRDVIAQLGGAKADRPEFDEALRHDLRAHVEAIVRPALGAAPAAPGTRAVWVGKHPLSVVHSCEARWAAEDANDDFAWSAATARGTVAHKAIELSIHWRREPVALDLVDEALARLEASENGFADWLTSCDEAERAEVRALANERVAAFLECWPPLKASWVPVTEARIRADLCEDRVVLSGKVDLSLGRADGLRAGKVLVDFKTGGFTPAHLEDLRFYALIETLRTGVPPRRLASYYLEQGRFVSEDVTVGLLEAAAERAGRGAATMIELRERRRLAATRPGPGCRWCPVLDTCDDGRAHLARIDDPDGDDDRW